MSAQTIRVNGMKITVEADNNLHTPHIQVQPHPAICPCPESDRTDFCLYAPKDCPFPFGKNTSHYALCMMRGRRLRGYDPFDFLIWGVGGCSVAVLVMLMVAIVTH